MRGSGSWDESQPLALAPESKQLRQQQSPPPPSSPDKPSLDSSPSTLAKQQYQQEAAAYPLTMPAWANVVVKEERHGEINNESGISADHYTSDTASPNSDRSMMAGQSGLSPNSASSASPEPRLPFDVSNDGSNMDESAYDYSRHQRQHHQSAGSSDGIASPEDLSRGASTSAPTERDNNNNGGLDGNGMGANDAIERPVVNAQGKVKLFRCKQCSFVATTKLKYWSHRSIHIKPGKGLHCHLCTFVTSYKHHLQYHLRTHDGYKPYNCEECQYACVNKSMLNSHMKSHSEIYQYQCADCSYATKYQHSLKLHLRKFTTHQAAMVLDAEGRPNPHPVIDVYGRKRGPKSKPKKGSTAEQQQQQQQQQLPIEQAQQQQPLPQQQSSPSSFLNGLLSPIMMPMISQRLQLLNAMSGINAMNGIHAMNNMNAMSSMNAMNGISGIHGINPLNGINPFNGFNDTNALQIPNPLSLLGFPFNQLVSGFPMGNPIIAAAAHNLANVPINNNLNDFAKEQQTNYDEPVDYSKQAMMNGGDIMIQRQASGISYNGEQSHSPVYDNAQNDDRPVDLTDKTSSDVTPLDLSKPEKPKQVSRLPGSTNRRKGRAVKLDRRVLENDSDEEMFQERKIANPPVEANVYMQIQCLRTDMQNVIGYIHKLEENLSAKQ